MNIQSTRSGLPPLPQPPNGGKGRLETDVTYTAPDTVETRLGSIPADYETLSGREMRERIYFKDDVREAQNPRGRSKDIWRALPTYNADGSVKMTSVTQTLVAEPIGAVSTGFKKGALLGLVGAGAGALVGGFAFSNIGVGAAVGAGLGLGLGVAVGVSEAAADRVRLEWQETPITEKVLSGYVHDVDEDTRTVCTGSGSDQRCHEETDDYEHEFTPIIQETTVGTYFKPVVVHYQEGK